MRLVFSFLVIWSQCHGKKVPQVLREGGGHDGVGGPFSWSSLRGLQFRILGVVECGSCPTSLQAFDRIRALLAARTESNPNASWTFEGASVRRRGWISLHGIGALARLSWGLIIDFLSVSRSTTVERCCMFDDVVLGRPQILGAAEAAIVFLGCGERLVVERRALQQICVTSPVQGPESRVNLGQAV